MKILGLILVTFYAALMLFALWKQMSQRASAEDGTAPTGDILPNVGPSARSGKQVSLAERLPSIFIGAGCLLLLAYALLCIIQGRSLMPLLILGMLGISVGALQNGMRQKKVHLSHHIVRLAIEVAVIAICWMGVGGSPGEMPSLETKKIGGAQAVLWEGRTYVPFCVVSKADCGEQIGCLNGDEDDRISAYKGYPPEQWLVSWLPMDGGAILLKEITVDQIPDGLEDEYHITP